MEIGITGGVEDGVDNSGLSRGCKDVIYRFAVYKGLNPISPMFTIAAAFGNVHGVYKAGNVVLKPELLEDMQVYAREQIKATTGQDIERPLNFVFHGGSGSEKHHITTALNAGVVKMNVDTDTQWAYWEGLLKFYKAKEGYLQGQIGNPEGEDKPNKSYYDPRKWIRECEMTMVKTMKYIVKLGPLQMLVLCKCLYKSPLRPPSSPWMPYGTNFRLQDSYWASSAGNYAPDISLSRPLSPPLAPPLPPPPLSPYGFPRAP
ncbi:fba [Symbiodinium pilosum]|uniref:fructose-bisphosphate aldolase n=1 Tax=Symbiodinium pilosum TaxID=2952 RepID=A0A812UBJ1_SYMPI|nr:fba [Symbiodinium pilosum]